MKDKVKVDEKRLVYFAGAIYPLRIRCRLASRVSPREPAPAAPCCAGNRFSLPKKARHILVSCDKDRGNTTTIIIYIDAPFSP